MEPMPERNRAVQRAARRTRDRHKTGSYTEVRTVVRRSLRQVPMPTCPAMLDSTVWSRYGRWAFGTDDWLVSSTLIAP